MKKSETKAIISILFMTFVWGGTFPLVKAMLAYISPMALLTYRFFFAAIVAVPFFIFKAKKEIKNLSKLLLLGCFLWIAYAAQTVGLNYTTSSKSAFITGLYIVFTPIFALLIIKEKPSKRLIVSLLFAIIGILLLSGVSITNFTIGKGGLITIFSAIAFAIQIVLTNIYVKDSDMSFITAVQMIVMFGLSALFLHFKLDFKFPLWINLSLIFLGTVAGFFSILAETYSLKFIDPDKASILFSLEPVFAGVFSFIFLKEALEFKDIVGSILILIAMWLAIKSNVSRNNHR